MRLQALAQLLQSAGAHGPGFGCEGTEADLGMVAQHPPHELLIENPGLCKPRQQHLLLDAEVRGAMLPPKRDELVGGGGDFVIVCPAQSLGGDQRPMVIARELLQGWMPLHVLRVVMDSRLLRIS